MIKGVNKRIVEVRFPESPYFEKAVVFLRSDCSPGADLHIAEEMKSSIVQLESAVRSGGHISGLFGLRIGTVLHGLFEASVIVCAAAAIWQFIAA